MQKLAQPGDKVKLLRPLVTREGGDVILQNGRLIFELHGVRTQKSVLFLTAVRTSSPPHPRLLHSETVHLD